MTKIPTKKSSTALESTLESRKRVIAWLKNAQATTGFRDLCRNGAPFLPRSQKSAFLFHLVLNCNLRVMEIFDPIGLKALSILMIQLTRTKLVGLEEMDVNDMKIIVQNLVAEAAGVEDAVVAVSHHYLAGQEILFSDMQKELLEVNQKRQKFLSCYNSTAAIVGFEPINTEDLQPILRRHAVQIAGQLIIKSRADAKLASNRVDKARRLLSILTTDQPWLRSCVATQVAIIGEMKTNMRKKIKRS